MGLARSAATAVGRYGNGHAKGAGARAARMGAAGGAPGAARGQGVSGGGGGQECRERAGSPELDQVFEPAEQAGEMHDQG